MQTRRKGLTAPLRVARLRRGGHRAPSYDKPVPDASWRERITERAVSALLWLGRFRAFRYPLIKFLTSPAALPLIRLRQALKRRKYRGAA